MFSGTGACFSMGKARFKPVIAVPISVTEMIPMKMPRVVNTDRILFALIARNDIRRPSFSSQKNENIVRPSCVKWSSFVSDS